MPALAPHLHGFATGPIVLAFSSVTGSRRKLTNKYNKNSPNYAHKRLLHHVPFRVLDREPEFLEPFLQVIR